MRLFWPKDLKDWRETVTSIINQSTLSPFHSEVLSFLQSISKGILKDRSYRRYPELIALAFWLRKAHLAELQANFEKKEDNKVILPRGVALHFAPSNVDTIFVYSWVLSMLAGNANILRISGRKREQTEQLLRVIVKSLENHPEVAARTAILTYGHNDEITEYLSEHCHIRVIWGGDETVKGIRSIPLSALATEIAFPDRFSLSAFEAISIVQANEKEFHDLIHCFFNDGFWFAQMACSSPRMIVWIGEEQVIKAAQKRFWNKLNEFVSDQQKEYSPALQVQKLSTGLFLSAKENITNFEHMTNFSRLKVDKMDLDIRQRHSGGGLFVELARPKLEDLIPCLEDKDQTISYFGFTHNELKDFAFKLKNRSIDRIVPIGQALDFEGVWDGHDLIMNFTREIVIR